jgi:prepilin-type N-terminal cleavage/methylation domain-containing protein
MSSTPFRQRLALQVLAKRNRIKAAGAQGFTLIELLVVIVILGVLGGIGYGAYINQIERANRNTAAVAATAAAKTCAALLATGDPAADFEPGVDGTRVQISPETCATGTVYTVTAGADGNNPITANATINANGAVIPGATGLSSDTEN